MFSLAEVLYESFFAVPNYSILIAGHENVGKTTFFEQIRYLYDPALQREAADALKKTVVKEQEYKSEAHFHPLEVNSSSVQNPSSVEHADNPLSLHPSLSPSYSSLFTLDGVDLSSSSFGAAVVPSAKTEHEYLIPASKEMLDSLHISPTIGLNYAKVVHREVAAVAALHASALFPTSLPQQPSFVPSLPPPPVDANIPKLSTSFPKSTLKPCTLTLWDVSGQRTLRGLWSNYFKPCQGVIFIVDATLHLRVSPPFAVITKDHIAPLRALYSDYHKTLRHLLSLSILDDVPFLILGNKCDVPGHLTTAQLQDALALEDIALDRTFYTSHEWRSHGDGIHRNKDKTEEDEVNTEDEAASTPQKDSHDAQKSSATSHLGDPSTATPPPTMAGSSSSDTSSPSRGQQVASNDGKEGGVGIRLPPSPSATSIQKSKGTVSFASDLSSLAEKQNERVKNRAGDEKQKTTSPNNGHSADLISTPDSDGKLSRAVDSPNKHSLNTADPFLTRGKRQSREGFGNKTVKLMSISALTGHTVALAMDWMVRQLQEGARTASPS